MWEEAIAVVFLFVFLGAMYVVVGLCNGHATMYIHPIEPLPMHVHTRFWVPAGLVFFMAFNREPIYWVVLLALFLLLSLHPIPRLEAAVHSRLNRVLFRYFSLRMVRTVCSYY